MKKVQLLLMALLMSMVAMAQKAWIDDVDNFDPDDTTKIMVDISKCDCQRLLGSTDPLYIWTWEPSGDDDREAEFKNGEWTASNPSMAMTNEGGDIWSFKMVPTVFYNVDAATVYTRDFSFLVKGVDGTGDGGGGCDEDKTEDLMISVDPPPSASGLLRGFPQQSQPDDVFTLIYDNSQETKEAMQNLGAGEVLAYAAAVVDSVEYPIQTFFNLQNSPKLEMNYNGEGEFSLTFIPDEFFADVIPEGGIITRMEFAIRKRAFLLPEDKSDEELGYAVGCE